VFRDAPWRAQVERALVTGALFFCEDPTAYRLSQFLKDHHKTNSPVLLDRRSLGSMHRKKNRTLNQAIEKRCRKFARRSQFNPEVSIMMRAIKFAETMLPGTSDQPRFQSNSLFGPNWSQRRHGHFESDPVDGQ